MGLIFNLQAVASNKALAAEIVIQMVFDNKQQPNHNTFHILIC